MAWLPGWMRLAWLSDWVLSRQAQQKAVGRRFLVGVANCTAGVLALNLGATQGLIDPEACRWLTMSALAVALGFYAVLRSGLNLRLRDPSLVEPQSWATVAFLVWGYVIGGPGRGLALLLLVVILLFGMFTNTPRQLVRTCLLAAVAFGTAMWHLGTRAGSTPQDQALELAAFCMLVLALCSVCLLVSQMTRLRMEAQQRQQALSEALERIRELATHDELTGLFNRRHMLELLHTERHRCMRTGRSFCLAMIDIDHFKRVNDRLGHGAGDEVLAAVATAILAGLRETDIVARWGGEEFLVMFTDTPQRTAQHVLQRIQQTLSRTQVTGADTRLRVTFSAGVADHPRDALLPATIDRADRALYAAKAAGRDRVLLADSPEAPSSSQAA